MSCLQDNLSFLPFFLGLLIFSSSPWIIPILMSFLPDTTHYREYVVMVGLCLGSIAGGILGGQILNQRAKKVFIVNIIFFTIFLPLLLTLGMLISISISELINLLKHSFIELTIILIRIELMMIIILIIQYIGVWLTRNPTKNKDRP